MSESMKLGSGAGRVTGRGLAAALAGRATTGVEAAATTTGAVSAAGAEAVIDGVEAAAITGGGNATAEAGAGGGGGGAAAITGAGIGAGTTGVDAGRAAATVGAAPGPVVVDGCDALPTRARSSTFFFSSATRAASAWRWRSLARRSSALPGDDGGVTPPLLSLSVSGLALAGCFLSSTDAVTRPALWRLFGSATGAVPCVDAARRWR